MVEIPHAQRIWPIDEARRLYHEAGQESLDFTRLVAGYLSSGYVYSGPDCFILARPIVDTWFVRIAVGRGCLARFLEMMPFPLPYLQWERKLGKASRKWRLEDFKKKVKP